MSVEGWEIKKIDELALVDQETLSESTDKNFCFYYIDIGSIIEGNLLIPSNTITFKEAPSRARKRVYFSDVLMSTVRPNLKSFVYFDRTDNNYIASTGFAVLSAKDGVDPRFILYSILSDKITAQIESYIVGSNYPAINSNDVRNLQVLTPPFVEQQQIANILSTVDRAIAQTEALIAKQQRIKTGLMQDLLTKGIDENGNIRSEETHEFKDSAIGRIPVEWDVKTLADLAEVDRGKFTHRPRNDPKFYGGDHPFIQTGDITSHIGRIVYKYTQTLNDRGTLVSKEFPKNTIAVTIAANIADTAILGISMFFPDSVVGVKVFKPNNTRFVEMMIRHFKPVLDGLAPQSAQKNINLEVLRPLKIPTPKPQEQRIIGELYNSLDSSQANEELILQKLSALKTGLMQDLLTGKVRVTPLLENSGGTAP
ncbi:MAG: restriction endonuclease subunit S [Phormidium sp. BM_Day4_Bin.17]|nr:restriction endonuclease subunit S [Phormidium sp. BM_Day4_Bin.17]UCJ10600.1 MAG: restriction endonuclease subunit S [Phormidium sp. PBR-2020]